MIQRWKNAGSWIDEEHFNSRNSGTSSGSYPKEPAVTVEQSLLDLAREAKKNPSTINYNDHISLIVKDKCEKCHGDQRGIWRHYNLANFESVITLERPNKSGILLWRR